MTSGPNFPPQGGYPATTRPCPYCRMPATMQFCETCGRDTTAPRRPCPHCRQMVPSNEPRCWNCGTQFRNEMWWKIPLIVLIFVIAIILSLIIRFA
jgi:hypothetical protein